MQDSAYQEWYDEAEHPLSARTGATRNSNNIDTFFDAIFGGSGEAGRGATTAPGGSILPQTILETSLLYPWQAALAAALQVALSILKITTGATTTTATAADLLCQNLMSVDHRKASAASVLKIVDPTHSRNTWLAASKGAELYPASGALLHLVHQLRVLLLRTSRRTSPMMLAGYLSLSRFVLDTAEKEIEDATTAGKMASATTSKAPWLPLNYVGHIVKSFCCYPPLLAGSFNAASAQALPRLASAGASESIPDSTAYTAGVLWLIVQSSTNNTGNRRAVRPEWLTKAIPEARSHPLIAAAPVVQSAAVTELLRQLAGNVAVVVHNDDDSEGESVGLTSLMPLVDACAAAAFCLHHEHEEHHDGDGAAAGGAPSVQTRLLLGHSSSMASLASVSSVLLAAFADSAEALAAALDAISTSATATATDSGKLAEIEQCASFLGIGLEFIEIISLVAPLLQQAEPATSSTVLPVLERCTGVQSSCLELLRTLSEDSEVYIAAVQGLENAPVLALPPASNDDDEEEEEQEDDEESGEPLEDHENDTNASDRVELSAYERRKRLKDIRNPYLRVIVAESRRAAGDAADGDLSDLEDFIVANPERDYGDFIADHFPMAQESDGEEGEEDSDEEEEEQPGDGGGGAE
jgi:hypothetical protein